jgi:hypothetical protein
MTVPWWTANDLAAMPLGPSLALNGGYSLVTLPALLGVRDVTGE